MKTRALIFSVVSLCFLLINSLVAQNYQFESVPNDNMNVRIYTLNNGLKVYMSVYKDEPRVQALIAVRVGAKNDPSDVTGLAHYFEHMMFKGTTSFGTSDWAKEKPLIDNIESMFEEYRITKEPEQRAFIYKKIDSLSYLASGYAIPNEYDKMMKFIGSRGTNAATSYDYTYYIESVPSNQLENWAYIQADRFSHPVLRLFHTELETVYEEKNMSLTNDNRKVMETMLATLYPNHPYGRQTVLGSPEHLRNPSMKNIRRFFDEHYVPNNMAIILAGDFDPDKTIALVDKYFGKMKPVNVPEFTYTAETELGKPIEKEVIGLDAENVQIGFRFPGNGSDESLMLNLLSLMLFNQKAGLIDLNINQKQLTLSASAYPNMMGDYSTLMLNARPKSGQTLEECKNLLLEQIILVKNGEFPDWMLEAAVNNLKLQEMRRLESISSRANLMMNSFIYNIPWEKQVNYIQRIEKITKFQLMEFAQNYLKDNYVVIYKRQGKPDNLPKVQKPPITPIQIIRDKESDFFKKVQSTKVEQIQPQFLNFTSDFQRLKTNSGLDIYYVPNTANSTFTLYFYFKTGRFNDKKLNLAFSYLPYLGTSKLTASEIQQEFYKLACTFSVSAGEEESWVTVSGLKDNFTQALQLTETILKEAVPDVVAYQNLVSDILKSRKDSKSNQNANFSALVDYATYGENSPGKFILSEEELHNVDPRELVQIIHSLSGYNHKILYYGADSPEYITEVLNTQHVSNNSPVSVQSVNKFEPLDTKKNIIYFAPYDANQSFMQIIMKSTAFNKELIPLVYMYNAYFGGGMNAIVFQELREKRSLAYASRSNFIIPEDKDKTFMNASYIATQNDKIIDAITAFNDLFDNMPVSEKTFQLAQESVLNKIETERIRNMNIIWTYFANEKLGFNYDYRKDIYTKVKKMTIKDVINFNNKYLKNKSRTYAILGREKELNLKELEKTGKVIILEQKDIFGY